MTAADILEDERAHVRLALACVQDMRRAAESIDDVGLDELTAHALGRLRADRLAALSVDPDAPPFFGRTDTTAGNDEGRVEVFHLGRRHVRDAAGDPVVVDWRAPLAGAYYRATAADPRGVSLRRRFGYAATAPGTAPLISSFEDEHLDRGEEVGLASDLLRSEIEAPREGPMRDIVATIQPDQDELVRSGLDVTVCVQGAPGTGKTAVGLHRAVYLLYTYPERLRRSGVLVVGPNAAFLTYIGQVLPALGEAGIEQATVARLTGHVTVRATDTPEVAVLKGDARLAGVLHRALLAHISRPVEDVVALVGTKRYRIPERRLRRYVDDARRALAEGDASLHWASARDRLRLQLGEDVRRQREDAGGAPSDSETRAVARSRPVRDFVDVVWPALRAPAVLAELYTDPAALARAAAGVLDEAEQAALRWDRAPRSLGRAPWTAADTALLDELVGLIDGVPVFAHAVVDEAQDLSAMQCRAVARRCPTGSLTVLGDLAQATTRWAPGSWPATLAHLGRPDTPVSPLTVGYRVPGSVLALANRLLPHIAPELPPAESVRAAPDALRLTGEPVTDVVAGLLAHPGSVGVIATAAALPGLAAELAAAGLSDPRVELVAAEEAKGLEFDAVAVVEPADIVAAETVRLDGLRRLYVVLTRAVSHLAVVHTAPLPPELSPG